MRSGKPAENHIASTGAAAASTVATVQLRYYAPSATNFIVRERWAFRLEIERIEDDLTGCGGGLNRKPCHMA